MTLHAVLSRAMARLVAAGAETPERDARLLFRHASGMGRAELISHERDEIDSDIAERFFELIDRRAGGMPVHRIIGSREFHGLKLKLSVATLEPRDDTETLVDLLLDWARQTGRMNEPLRFADVGTGTGAIALALLSEMPNAQAFLTDLSADALATARENAGENGYAGRCEFAAGSWCEPLTGEFNFIVSNPPYIASETIETLSREVRDHDPRLALDGGGDGLDAYRALFAEASSHLSPDGGLFLEIGHDQAESVTEIAGAHGWSIGVLKQDYSGNPRVISVFPVAG